MSTTRSTTDPAVPILVLGDINLDTVIAPMPLEKRHFRAKGPLADEEIPQNWQSEVHFKRFRRPGGAWLLSDIVTAAVGPEGKVLSYNKKKAAEFNDLGSPPCLDSLATIAAFPKEPKKDGRKEELVYRLASGSLLGWAFDAFEDDAVRRQRFQQTLEDLLKGVKPPTPPRLIVIHDHNNGFRNVPPSQSIELFLTSPHFCSPSGKSSTGVLLWHMDSPLAKGPLWDSIHKEFSRQIVVVVTAEDLRDSGVNLVEDLSFEQTAYDFMSYMDRSGPLADLAKCRDLIVRFPNGTIHYHPAKDAETMNISFLPYARRTSPAGATDYGKMVGYTSILVGAVAKGIVRAMHYSSKGADDFEARLTTAVTTGAQTGCILAQMHYRNGFGRWGFQDDRNEPTPYENLFKLWEEMQAEGKTGERAIDNPVDENKLAAIDFDLKSLALSKNWSRIDEFCKNKAFWKVNEEAAIEVVRRGLVKVIHDYNSHEERKRKADAKAVGGSKGKGKNAPEEPWPWRLPPAISCPYAQVGDLKLVDRDEIDRYSSIEVLVSKYLAERTWARPLSIAVFGPPGSGKSFGVKQILKSARAGAETRALEYNVSQFRGINDLAIAFHQAQDRSLSDEMPPLVVFDEFDASFQNEWLGWLKYFLAPMQDGLFKDGDSMYQVGRAIFVFTGGTHESFGDFYDKNKATDKFKAAKGTDFVSRLRGHLNIVGINSNGPVSDLVMFRRAILLRLFLEQRCGLIIDQNTKEARIDEGVIRAFLRTAQYEHGVRSMEAIVDMAGISRTSRRFQKSSVPPAAQLQMHVNADEFLGWVHQQV